MLKRDVAAGVQYSAILTCVCIAVYGNIKLLCIVMNFFELLRERVYLLYIFKSFVFKVLSAIKVQ